MIQLEYRFDRLLAAKLEQVYDVLVPDKRWLVRTKECKAIQEEELNEQTRRHLRSSVFGSAEGEPDHRESDGSAEGVRGRSGLSGAGGMGI
jgi:hypothetical protein